MMKRRVRFGLLSFIAALGQVVLSSAANATQVEAATIMQETLKGDAIITRNVTAPKPGAYLLILKNGTAGPHEIEQCDVEDSDEEKTECLSRNLSENVDQDFSRAKEAEIKINGRRVQGITNARSLLIVPVTLKGGTNKIDILLKGRSTSRLTVSLEPAPQAALPPEAAFLLSRLSNTVRTPFTFDAKESFSPNGNSLRYSWNFGDGAIESGKSRVSHSFSKPGTYSVQLTVTDVATRLSSSFSVDVTVLGNDKTKPPKNQKPKPVIQYALDTVNPLNVTFDGTSSTDDGTIVSYSWKIFQEIDHNNRHDHRITAERTGVQFDYSFPRAGSYTVRLTVKDNQGAEAATERVVSTADMSGLVRDESLFGPKKYYSKKKVVESFTLESPRLAVLKIKNADGLEHPIESCSSTPWPEKLGCIFQNSVNRAYIALYRVSKAEIFINGQRVTDRIGKHTAYFETVVSLQTSNTIEIRTKGWPSAFIELELQSLEVNEAPIVYVTHSGALRGIPQTIEFDASTSVDMNDHIMSYRFQALNAAGAVAIDTDWQAASYAALEFTERGTFTVVVSARDTFGAVGTKSVPITIESNQIPLVTASYVVLSNQAPYQVRITATASDPDGDAIQYNFAYSTGQVSGFQDSPQGLTSFAAAGTYSVDVTARDANGDTATFTLPITVGGNLLPIANFDFVTDRGGYAPLTITVDASPSSDPDDAKETLRYFWTFGDNSPRVEGKVLSHTFINQGQYTVTLSVLDPKRGLSTKSRAAFAWRTTPPNPVLIANPRLGPASLTVDFDASQSTPGASPIASYLFDYADGTFDRSLSPYISHTFTQPGIYNVGLIVYDTDGNGNIGGQTIYVFDGKKPSAAIQVVSSDIITPARFELQGSGVSPNPLATITDYKWTLPNGTVQTGASLIYTTSTNGNFNIQLQVKDSYGYWSDPAILDLSAASGTLPIAQITADKTRIALGQAVKLSGLNSYTSNGQANLVSYEWTLPNGTKIYGPEKTVTLSATGLKTISLIVTDSKGYVSSPATIQIQVDARQTPVPAISMTTSGTVVPVTAFLNGLQSTTPNPGALITGYEWKIEAAESVPPIDFSLFGAEVSAQLVVPYTHTISLRVFDSAGAVSGWVSKTFGPLINNSPVAVVTPSAVIAKAPATVILSAIESTDPDGHSIANAHWLFSDGTDFQGLIATHEFSNTGTYSATVRVQDQYGAWSDPVTVPITLNANLPPVALMTSVSDANNKFNFTFDASTSFDLDGTIARYDWFFSDGFISLGAGPTITHAFPTAGTWRAGVNVFDNNGAMTTIQVSVEVAPSQTPVADITVLPTSTDPKGLSFKFSGAGSTVQTENSPQFTWNFGDQTPQVTGIDVDKTFTEEGVYNVILTIRNQDGVSASESISFYAYDHAPKILQAVLEAGSEHANSYFGQTAIQREVAEIPALIKFSAANSKASVDRVLSYTWDFGDGSPLGYGIETQHRYVKPGVFTARLTIKDQDGNEASDTTAFGLSNVNCAFRESDSTCLILSGTNDLIVDEQQNTFTLEITGAEDLDPALATDDNVLELLLNNETLIDLKGKFSLSGRQITVQTAAIQPYVYDGTEFTIQLNGRSTTQNDVWATLRKLRFSAGSINATLPIGIKLLQVAGADYLKTFASPGTSLSLSALPRGPYTFTATFADENVMTKSVGVTSGLATIDFTAPQITSLQTKMMMKMATLPESDEIQRLATRPWPSGDYVASLKQKSSPSMKSTQLVTQQASSNEVTNVYKNACGQSSPYAVVMTSINELDTFATSWQDFLSNNPAATPDPNAKLFKPLSTISSGESSIHVRCQLQSPSIQDQFNQWYRSTSRQCCDPNDNYCNMIVDQTYAYLTKDYARDDQPVIYQIKFKDTATGNIVTRSSSFTFNSVAAAKGYSRNNMTSILGLPANDFVAGWNVPHEFDIPIPKGMSNIEYAVDVQSTFPNERYTHAYYCWTGKRIKTKVHIGITEPTDSNFSLPYEHVTLLGNPSANMRRSVMTNVFPIERDYRTSGNTYDVLTASQSDPYRVKTSILLKIDGYGLQTEGYRYIKSAKINLETSYLPASDLESVTRSVTNLSASAITVSNLTCTTQTKSTSCKGDLIFTPDELGLTQSEISTHQVEDLNIRPVPKFFDESGVEIADLAFNGQTQPYSSTLSNQMARKATYNVLPNPDLPETRHCAEIYSTGTSIGFAQRSLARTVAGKFNDMGTNGFQIACNDAGLPFGGFLHRTAVCLENDSNVYPDCPHGSFPHRGPEHRKARAIDIRYFSKDRNRRERLDLTGGANKILVMTDLYNYVQALIAHSNYCTGKMTTSKPTPSTEDPLGRCQDSTGARRFTGQECMINRERIHAAKLMAEPPPASYWTWDAAVTSTLAKSNLPYTSCPLDEGYTYSIGSTTYQSVDDAINYAADFRDGVISLFTSPIRKTKLKFTFGTQGDLTTGLQHSGWNNKMLNSSYSFSTVPSNITIYRQGVALRSSLPAINKLDLDGHLDHLHLEVDYEE